jgi:hypothetical protein
MQVYFKFEANEIEQDRELSYYNNAIWKFTKHNCLGFTHVRENYDDVSSWPDYDFGVYEDGKFVCLASGEGNPIPTDRIGTGGVWIEVYIVRPDLSLKVIK